MHFVIPRQYEAIVPPSLARWKKELVVASGVAEIAGGIAILPGPHAPRRALVAARDARRRLPGQHPHGAPPERFPKIPAAALWARLPVQGLFALLTWRGTR